MKFKKCLFKYSFSLVEYYIKIIDLYESVNPNYAVWKVLLPCKCSIMCIYTLEDNIGIK